MIKIIEGDLFDSKATIIAHQVNCQGRTGSGVALQVKQKYPHVYEEYKKVCSPNMLGEIQVVSTEKVFINLYPGGSILDPRNQYICNMFGQLNYGYDGKQYTSLETLEACFYKLKVVISKGVVSLKRNNLNNIVIAMPYKIGCARGGADWNEVYKMIEEIFYDCNVELWKYDKG